MDSLKLHIGSLVIGLLFSLFAGKFMSVIAYAGCNGAYMAKRKTFRLSSTGFFLFYLIIHTIMFW